MSSRRFFLSLGVLLLTGMFVEASAEAVTPCAKRSVSTAGIRTTEDVEAFVQCAYEYVQEMGFEEAYRAFHEDERWNSGQFYVFVRMLAPSSEQSQRIIQPTDQSSERMPLGPAVDGFDTDLIGEFFRVFQFIDRGWVYYEFLNPASGLTEPKAAYLVRIDWQGEDAVLGSGIYRQDIPGACHAAQVNAALLEAEPSMERLEEFVRCAALEIESKGYFAAQLLENDGRWRDGSIYLFGMDTMGNQLFSGHPITWNGGRIAEWLDPEVMFRGRDMIEVANTFGESRISYGAIHPQTGSWRNKTAFLKRVSGHGVPLLVGAGIYMDCPPGGCGGGGNAMAGGTAADGSSELVCKAARGILADFPATRVQYGFYNDFNPVSYSEQGAEPRQARGYEPDLIAAVETFSEGRLSFNPLEIGYPFSGVWLKAAQEPYDLVGGGITALPERTRDAEGRQVIRFGVGHISFFQSLLVRAESPIERYDDLTAEHRVGLLRGATGEKRLLELTGIIDEGGFLRAGTRILLADGTLLTAGEPDSESALRIAAGAGSAAIASRVRLTPPGEDQPEAIYFDREGEQIRALLEGMVDAVARWDIGNRIAARDYPGLRVTAIDTAGGERSAFSYPDTPAGDALRVTMNAAIGCLTANGTVGFTEWLDSEGAIFAARAEELLAPSQGSDPLR